MRDRAGTRTSVGGLASLAPVTRPRESAPRYCTFTGCKRPKHAHGWCDRHYRAWQRYGDPGGRRPVVFNEAILLHAEHGMRNGDFAKSLGITSEAAAVRIAYWRKRGIIAAATPLTVPRVYVLTDTGRRDLALSRGIREDQYDAGRDLAAALGYTITPRQGVRPHEAYDNETA